MLDDQKRAPVLGTFVLQEHVQQLQQFAGRSGKGLEAELRQQFLQEILRSCRHRPDVCNMFARCVLDQVIHNRGQPGTGLAGDDQALLAGIDAIAQLAEAGVMINRLGPRE